MRFEAIDVRARGEDERIRELRLPAGPLGRRAAAELIAACDELAEDRTVRAVALTGDGGFVDAVGGDLVPESFAPDPAAALARLRPPVVAAVAGRCRSVGLELALAADIRLADRSARFALDDSRAGRLPSWGGTQRLPRCVGLPRATAMVLLGAELDAPAALEAGLVSVVTDELDRELDEVLGALVELGPLALELAKEAVARGAELPLRDGLRLEGDLNHLLQGTADRAEGLAAFFAKRPPDFAGR